MYKHNSCKIIHAADNVLSFCVQQQKPWQANKGMPPEAAELYYMKGTCQVELGEYSPAHDSFNDAIKVDAKYSEVSL